MTGSEMKSQRCASVLHTIFDRAKNVIYFWIYAVFTYDIHRENIENIAVGWWPYAHFRMLLT